MKNSKKKRIYLLISCVLLAACIVVGVFVAASMYVRSIQRGYPLKITSTFVAFTLNGNTYLNDIGSDDLQISKGEQCDFVLQVGIRSNQSAYVDYRLRFRVEAADGAPIEASDALMNAIEVYRYDGSTYRYVCQLGEIGELENGEPKYFFSGELSTELTEDLYYRLVYSPETSAEYDAVAKDGKFIIHAYADEMEFVTDSNRKYVYINDTDSFVNAFASPDSVGKTLILNRDITVPSDLTSAGKLSIHLNGHTMDPAGHTLRITDGGTAEEADVQITLQAGIRATQGPSGTVYVPGSLSGSGLVLPEGIALIDRALAPNVQYTLPADVLNRFTEIVSARAAQLDGKKNYRFGDDVSFLFTGLEYLIGQFNGVDVCGGPITMLPYDENYVSDGFVKIVYDADTGFTVSDAEESFKTRYSFLMQFKKGEQMSAVSGAITLQGSSAYAIAQMLASQIPDVITHSYILRQYDTLTAANVEWLVYDQYDGMLFDRNGIFRREGLQALRAAMDANGEDYYTPRDLQIFVKVSKGADTCTYYVPGITALPFSAEELTEFVYNDISIAVADGVPYRFANYIDSETKTPAGLRSITVAPVSGVENNAADYIDITYDANGYPVLTLKDNVDTNFIGKTKLQVTFTYENDETYSVVRDVTLVGDAKFITAYDVSSALQADYTSNPYVEGKLYEFTAHSVLAPTVSIGGVLQRIPVFVEYDAITPAAREFLSFTYDFIPVEYSEMDDFYAYFTYDEEQGCYIFAETDSDGRFEEGKTYFERRAVVEILPARVSYTDTEVVTIGATLYTMDETDPTMRYAPAGTVDGKAVIGKPHTINIGDQVVKAYYEPATGVVSYLSYPLTLEIAGIITNTEEGVPDYNLYSNLLKLYDGVLNGIPDGILTTKEAHASWDAVLENLARKGISDLVTSTQDMCGLYASGYFTGVSSGTGNEIFTAKPFSGIPSGEMLSLEDFVAAVNLTDSSKTVGPYATFWSASKVGQFNNQISYYVLKRHNFAGENPEVTSYKWGALEKDSLGNVVVPASAGIQHLWDYIRIEIVDGRPVYPADYNTEEYLPGVYLVFFQNYGGASNADASTLYNRYYQNANGDFIHINTIAECGTISKRYNNPSIIGPFTWVERESFSYVNLNNIPVTSLAGIENFPNLRGLSLHNSGVSDLTPLEGLIHLSYLDLSGDEPGINTVTDLAPLKYLDQLILLDLENTNVTSLDEIRYLKSLYYLNISNTGVNDFAAIADLKNLRNLRLTKNGLTNNSEDMYHLSRAVLNAGDDRFYLYNGGEEVGISDVQLVVSAVMRDLENFNRVNHTLYLPLTYTYNGATYDLRWFSSSNSLISIDNDSPNGFASYTIQSPLFDTPMEISVQVLESESTTGGETQYTYFKASRIFPITLEAGSQEYVKYIYNYNQDSEHPEPYVPIDEVIPDLVLRNLIFSTFNTTSDTTGYNGSGAGFVISKAELEQYRNTNTRLDWSALGINDLTGIEYLYPLFDQSDFYLEFNLSGNPFDDLTPLNALKLNVLILGGKEYDLSQLSGLTTLYALDVHECVNVSSEESLAALYGIYTRNNHVYIYKDSAPTTTYFNDASVAWNPYDEMVEKALHAMDSVFSFSLKGDYAYIFGAPDATEFTFSLYGRELTFVQTAGQIFQATACFTYDAAHGKAVYSTLNAWEESAMLKVTLFADDGHKGWNVSIGSGNIASYTDIDISVTHDWYVELIALDPGKKINVFYNGSWKPVSDLFTSYELLKGVYNWFFGNNGINRATAVSSPDLVTDNTYYRDPDSGVYFIPASFLRNCSLTFTKNDPITGKRISGDELLLGLELLDVKTLFLYRDAELGDGSHLVNVQSLSTLNSSLDLSVLKVPLPNLKVADFSAFSAFTATKEVMALMPSLETLYVGRGAENNQTEKVTDWSFLLGLIREDGTTPLKSLYIKNFTGNTSATVMTPAQRPLAQLTNVDWGNVYTLYRAVQRTTTPAFYLFTDHDVPITLGEDGCLYCDGTLVYSGSGMQTDLTIKTQDTYTYEDGYDIVTAQMQDLGLKVNGTYWLDSPTRTLSNSAVLTLPENTYEDWFGIQFTDGTEQRSYPISWKLYENTSSSNNFTSQTVSGTVSLADHGDRFVVLIGTVSCPGKPSYSYLYPFVVGNGDGLYSEVTDPTLRTWLFAKCATIDGVAAPQMTRISDTNGITDEELITILQNRGAGIAAGALPMDTTENFLFSLHGFDTVMTAAGMESDVTYVNLSNHEFPSIAALSCLSSLRELYLNDTEVKLSGYTVPSSLVTFEVKNDACFGLEDLAVLDGSNLTRLNVYGTGVQARYEAVDHFLSLSSGGNMQLAWEQPSVSDVSRSELLAFKSVIEGDTFQNIVSGFAVNDFDSSRIISGSTVSMPYESYNLLLNFDIAPEVDTVLTVSFNDNDQLFVYYPAKCVKIGADTGYIGTGTDTLAKNYDTELLARLYALHLLVKSGQSNLVGNGNANITENIGIKNVPANGTVDGISVSVSHNTLVGPEAQTADAYIPVLPGRELPTNFLPLVNAENQTSMIDEIFKSLPRELSYSGNSYTVTVEIPKYLYIAGVPYEVDVTFDAPVGNLRFQNGRMILSFGNALVEGVTYNGNDTVTLTAGETVLENEDTFTVVRLGGEANQVQNNFLVEVQFDEETMIAYMVDDDGNPTVSVHLNQRPDQLYLKNGAYYTTRVDGYERAIYYISASNFIKSGRLRTYLYWISEFNGGNNANYRPFRNGRGTLYAPVYDGEIRYGKVLLNENALQLVNFRQALETGLGITSLEGLQMFANMETFYLQHNGITDIEPLSTLHLKSFQLQNSHADMNFMITDFTPLLRGSADTLEEFGYNGYGNVYATDLSFLTGFTSLQRVLIGARTDHAQADKDGAALTYLKSLPFQYVLASLYNRGVSVYVGIKFAFVQGGVFALDTTNTYTWTSYQLPGQILSTDESALTGLTARKTTSLCALLPRTFDRKAAELLDNLSSALSPDRRTTYSDFQYGYRYDVRYAPLNGNDAYVYLPATIADKGSMYFIDWHAVTNNVSEINYILRASDGTETVLTMEELRTYIGTMDYYNAQKAGTLQVYAKLTVDIGDASNIAACDYTCLTCNVEIEDTNYQRMVTLQF